MSDIELYVRLVILLVLLILSGVFSSSETALTSMDIIRLKKLEEDDKKAAKILKRIKKKMNTMLATILIGNNLVNIAATAIMTELIVEIFKGKGSTLIATGIMTVLILIFGEVTPKTFANQNPEKVSAKVGYTLEKLSILFKPIIFILNKITSITIKIMGGDMSKNEPFITEEDLKSLMDVGEEEGVLKHQEKEMIEGVFEIDDIDVTEVMVPRIDIVAISEDATIEEALDLIIRFGHSRIPVFEDTIDNIIGILYAKDILPYFFTKRDKITNKTIRELMRQAYYVPETKKVSQLLKEFQHNKIHMAIVLDEYGGTEGLVTIEDILEEIVGDILDEFDNEIDLIEKKKTGEYLVKAEISLEEINEQLNLDLPEEDFESLGGFVFSTLGRVPIKGDFIKYRGYKMIVTSVVNRRIKQIKIEKIEESKKIE
ncbi:hemolysin family protein [Thermohalobacter berrensis]|uniref:hemolysin family protein n=1 Tax=Thermohalobacter berrensis TaxID=99594 RepID=UPI000E75286F|nr:hemolysin family protein [Thermohalobacter berrensis]